MKKPFWTFVSVWISYRNGHTEVKKRSMTVRMRVDRSYSPKDGMKVGFTYILTNFSIALLCRFNFCYVRRTSRRCCFDGITAADPPKLFDDMIGCHIRRKILLWLVGWTKSSITRGARRGVEGVETSTPTLEVGWKLGYFFKI